MLVAPGPVNSAAEARGGGGGQKRGGDASASSTEGFACAAYGVDRECRRLGYQSVLRQRRSGAEFVHVPVLLQNCSAMLALLAAGGGGRPAPPPPPPPPSGPCGICGGVSGVNGSNCVAAVGSGSCASVSASISGSRRGGWKRIFTRQSSSKAATSAAAEAAESAAAAAIASAAATAAAAAAAAAHSAAEELAADRRKEDTESCLQQLLAEVRFGTERLVALAGLEAADDSRPSRPPSLPPLTELQREVLYFQTRWPQLAEALGAKLTEAGRTVRRLAEEAAARARAEAGAKARSAVKMASMEAELRRLRGELRRCGRKGVRPPPPPSQTSHPRQQQQQKQQPQASLTQLPAAEDVETIGSDRGDEFDEA